MAEKVTHRRTTFRVGIALLAGLVLTASDTPLPSPPEELRMGFGATTDSAGYITARWYFSRKEWADPRWRAKILESANWSGACSGLTKPLRRDVRWFKPTGESEELCGMLVTTFSCEGSAVRGKSRLEHARLKYLLEGPPEEMPLACGDKFPREYNPNEDWLTKPIQRSIDASVSCNYSSDVSSRIRIRPSTRIMLSTHIEPAFASMADPSSLVRDLMTVVQRTIERGTHWKGSYAAFYPTSKDINQSDILIRQEFSIKNDGSTCVSLVAKQGREIWRKSAVSAAAPPDKDPSPKYLKRSQHDITNLANQLVNAMDLPTTEMIKEIVDAERDRAY